MERSMILIKEFLTSINMDFGNSLEREKTVLIELEGGVMLSLCALPGHISVAALIGTLPKAGEETIYRECLEVNFHSFPDMPYFFSLEPSSQNLFLMARWGVAETHFEDIVRRITELTQTALTWREKLYNTQPAGSEQTEQPTAPVTEAFLTSRA